MRTTQKADDLAIQDLDADGIPITGNYMYTLDRFTWFPKEKMLVLKERLLHKQMPLGIYVEGATAIVKFNELSFNYACRFTTFAITKVLAPDMMVDKDITIRIWWNDK